MPEILIPIGIICFVSAGVWSSKLFSVPSVIQELNPKIGARNDLLSTIFLIDGLNCVDTSHRVISSLNELDGVFRCTAYASHHELKIEYAPSLVNIEKFVAAIEGPIWNEESAEFSFNNYRVLKIDNRNVNH